MKLKDILKEEKEFTLYQALMRVGHTEEITASQVADFIRAMPGVTRVSAVESNEDTNMVVLKVKILTAKPAQGVYEKVRKDAFRLVPNIKKVEVAQNTIEPTSR
tara:strand:+ start:300 stop:611 length:312 start_codon:yes stop_codon:yes gene_type:complete